MVEKRQFALGDTVDKTSLVITFNKISNVGRSPGVKLQHWIKYLDSDCGHIGGIFKCPFL